MFEIEFEHEFIKVDDKALAVEIDAAIIAFLEDVAKFVEHDFHRQVPRGETNRLFGAVNRSRVEKSPKGFKVEIGIKPIPPSKPGESPQYPLFVDQGTGLFGERHNIITPTHGNVMVFEYKGRTIFTRFVEGQKGQHFSDIVYTDSKAYFKVKKHELARILSTLIAKGS